MGLRKAGIEHKGGNFRLRKGSEIEARTEIEEGIGDRGRNWDKGGDGNRGGN